MASARRIDGGLFGIRTGHLHSFSNLRDQAWPGLQESREFLALHLITLAADKAFDEHVPVALEVEQAVPYGISIATFIER